MEQWLPLRRIQRQGWPVLYLVSVDSSVYTLDLTSGGSPVLDTIFEGDSQCDDLVRSLVLTPWGDILQVWRFIDANYVDNDPVELTEDFVGGFIDPSREFFTDEIELYKVDISGHKLMKVSSSVLQGHAISLSGLILQY